MAMTDEARIEFLAGLGIGTESTALAAQIEQGAPANTATLAAAGVDPHAMPVSEIVFDTALLDAFPVLTGEGMNMASAHVFGLYKSHGRNKDRNSLLHRRITEFIGQVRRERNTGGLVKERVAATKDQRELAEIIAATGLTAADLAALINASVVTV